MAYRFCIDLEFLIACIDASATGMTSRSIPAGLSLAHTDAMSLCEIAAVRIEDDTLYPSFFCCSLNEARRCL